MSINAYCWLSAALLCASCTSAENPVRGQATQGSDSGPSLRGVELADKLGAVLASACPPNALEDAEDRTRCADALTREPTLLAANSAYLRWGGQTAGAGYEIANSNTTLFDPLVWRRLYLSTFAFPGEHRVEELADGRTILHVPVLFRNALDAGEYPYPFWHSQPKWQSYERTRELLFVFEDDEVRAVLRSEEQDPERAHVERVWDGQWRWGKDGEEPRVALYSYLLSQDNPHSAPLDKAYRAFSERQRAAACEGCHNPSNPSKINPLEFFNYPNQALTARHDIVEQLEANLMPPSADAEAQAGIEDEAYRKELLQLARTFADAGDKALKFELAR
jgi:hypothetical protein